MFILLEAHLTRQFFGMKSKEKYLLIFIKVFNFYFLAFCFAVK